METDHPQSAHGWSVCTCDFSAKKQRTEVVNANPSLITNYGGVLPQMSINQSIGYRFVSLHLITVKINIYGVSDDGYHKYGGATFFSSRTYVHICT